MGNFAIHQDYPCNAKNYKKGRTGGVEYIVIHYVGAQGGAAANAKYYASSKVSASAHYFVGHASEWAAVYASVPEGDTAWHCGGGLQGTGGHTLHGICKNDNSIGIEMCCHADGAGTWYFDDATVDRTVELTRQLMSKYGIPADRVVRHYDVTGKICPAPYVKDEGAWTGFKARLEDETMTQAEFDQMAAVNASALRAEMVDDWAKEAWEAACAKGVFDGSAPRGPITREQMALVLQRLGLV